jgi:hypothetical protein
MSPSSIVEMKRNTLAAISDCMNLEDLQVCVCVCVCVCVHLMPLP